MTPPRYPLASTGLEWRTHAPHIHIIYTQYINVKKQKQQSENRLKSGRCVSIKDTYKVGSNLYFVYFGEGVWLTSH